MRMAYLAKVAFEVCSLPRSLANCLLLRAQGKWGRDFLRDLGSRKAHTFMVCIFSKRNAPGPEDVAPLLECMLS